jgi:SH3-like domain-containing protein
MKKNLILFIIFLFYAADAFSDGIQYRALRDVNCRAGEFGNSLVLSVIKEGDVVDVLDSRDGWSFVKTADGKNGFVVSTFLEQIIDQKTITYIAESDLNCRQESNIESEVLFIILKDDIVKVLQRSNGWYFISTEDGKKGFVDGNYLRLLVENKTSIKNAVSTVGNNPSTINHKNISMSTVAITFLIVISLLYIFRRENRTKYSFNSRKTFQPSRIRTNERSAIYKGRKGEKRVHQLLYYLTKEHSEYLVIHDVELPVTDGITQIDHIVISQYGIFVIETKNYKGWIFGDEYQKRWQKTLYGAKYEFQNPLHQNYKHIKAVESLLDIEIKKIISVVVFVGDSEFKSIMPQNVIELPMLLSFIRSYNEKIFSMEDVEKIYQTLKSQRNSKWS